MLPSFMLLLIISGIVVFVVVVFDVVGSVLASTTSVVIDELAIHWRIHSFAHSKEKINKRK